MKVDTEKQPQNRSNTYVSLYVTVTVGHVKRKSSISVFDKEYEHQEVGLLVFIFVLHRIALTLPQGTASTTLFGVKARTLLAATQRRGRTGR